MRLLLIVILLLLLNIPSTIAEITRPYRQAVYAASDHNTLIDAEYPRFLYPKKHKKEIKLLNAEIRRFVHGLFLKFLSGDDVGRGIKKTLRSDIRKGSYKIRFEIIRADDEYVSIRFKTHFDQWEGVHGLVYAYTLNYDLKSSKPLYLTDLLEPNSDDVRKILKICASDLEKRIGKSWHKLSAKDLTHFSFNRNSLFLNFNSYKLTDNSIGSPEVKIPFERLEGLKKDFKN